MPEDSATGGPPADAGAPAERVETEDEIAELRRLLAAAVARVCPRWLAGHAEDIVQAAVLRLIEIRRRGGGIEEPGPFYLRKVAYNAAVDEMRRHYRRREVAMGTSPVLDLSPAPDPDPEQQARSREIDRGITDCLADLIPPRRLVVTLYLQSYTVPDAARSLGWSTKKAEHLTYRGLEDLRRCLGRKGLKP